MVKIKIVAPRVSSKALQSFYSGDLSAVSYYECAVLSTYSPEFSDIVAKLKGIRMVGFSPDSPPLFDHQERALAWMINATSKPHPYNVKGALIELEPGLGKTYLSCFYVLSRPVKTAPALVVVKSSIVEVWRKCLSQWFPGARVMEVLSGTKPTFGLTDLLSKDVVLTTYDCVKLYDSKHHFSEVGIVRAAPRANKQGSILSVNHRTAEQVRGSQLERGHECLFGLVWDNIVFDESHALANRKTKTFFACMGLTAKGYWCLSGSPFRNSHTDLWAQFRVLGYTGVLDEWKTLKEKVISAHSLDKCTLRMNYASTGFVMPVKYDYVVRVNLEGKFKQVYGVILGEVESAVDAYLENKDFACILSLFTRLRQSIVSPSLIASSEIGSSVHDKSFVLSEEAWREAPKIVKTAELTRASLAKNLKVIIFSAFKGTLGILSKVLEDLDPLVLCGDSKPSERDCIATSFSSDPQKKVLLATYSTGGEGLTFTSASVVIYVDDWWTPSSKSQAGSRSWRVGQTATVHTFTIYADNTVDTRIREVCQSKTAIEHKFSSSSTRITSKDSSSNFGIAQMRKLFSKSF